jgi:hypothetical protein
MASEKKISQLTPATIVNTNDFTVLVDGGSSQNKRATIAQIMAVAGGGTVTNVNVSGSQGVTISGAPITSAGTINVGLGNITPGSITATGAITGTNLSGTNTGDQTITLTGDVGSNSGTGTLTTTIGAGAVTNTKLANMSGSSLKGRASGVGSPQDLSMSDVNNMLPIMSGDSGAGGVKGLVPAPAAGKAAANTFLKADGTWTAPDINNLLPTQAGNTGKVLQTNGTSTSWVSTILSPVSRNAQTNSTSTATITPTSQLHTEKITFAGSSGTRSCTVSSTGLFAGARILIRLSTSGVYGITFNIYDTSTSGTLLATFITDQYTPSGVVELGFNGTAFEVNYVIVPANGTQG